MKHRNKGSFDMQHQSQDLSKGPAAGKSGLLIDRVVISRDEIERHIAYGKQLQAETMAAILSGAFRRIGAAFHRRPVAGHETAVSHGA